MLLFLAKIILGVNQGYVLICPSNRWPDNHDILTNKHLVPHKGQYFCEINDEVEYIPIMHY